MSALAGLVLAAGSATSPTTVPTDGPSGESVKSGPIGLVVIIVLCIGCYFLFKSMSKHLRTVREGFPAHLPGDPPRPPADRPAGGSTAAVTVEAADPDPQPPAATEPRAQRPTDDRADASG